MKQHEPESIPSDGPGQGGEFCLSGAPTRTPKLSKADEHRFEQLYGKKWRQIRRWIDRGNENSDPCPLNDPQRMPGWWNRNMKWRIPEEIELAAVRASQSSAPPSENPPADEQPVPPTGPEGEVKPPPQVFQKIDLENIDPEDGDRLRELKQIQAAKFSQLKDALKLGQDCSSLETKYLKLCETIDKIESRVTERLKKRGLYILREIVERDLAACAELLRQSKDAMTRRILENCPTLTIEQRAEVSTAVETARSTEERMLCRLDSLTSNDLLRDLTA